MQKRQTKQPDIREQIKTQTIQKENIANVLNDNYTTVGEHTIPRNEDDYIENKQDNTKNTPTFTLQRTRKETVAEIMNKINRNKANDIYKIKLTIIKDLTLQQTKTSNRSIDENEYPNH